MNFFFDGSDDRSSRHIEGFGQLKDRDQGGLFMTMFEKGDKASIHVTQLGKFLLGEIVCLPQFPDDLSECLFDSQVCLLVEAT